MATKQQAHAALTRLHPGARLENEDWNGSYDVTLDAPSGTIWSDAGLHCRVVNVGRDEMAKPVFWDVVIEEIGLLGPPVPCTADTCNSWDAERDCCEWHA